MGSLCLSEFGFTRDPFNLTPDPSFLYLGAGHREALAQLEYGIKARKGFVLLTGEVGTGKTTLIRALLERLEGSAQTAFVYNTVVNSRDLLRYICEDFGIMAYEEDHREIHDYLTVLNRFLLESYRRGENVVLIIDEAQNLSAEVLESVRLLTNFETSRDKLLQILMVGQPELRVKLDLSELRQLKQRIAVRHHLGPLRFVECQEYIETRIKISGGSPGVITPQALEIIYFCSGGIPRLVNILCDNGLWMAQSLGKRQVDEPMIRSAAAALDLSLPSRGNGFSFKSSLLHECANGSAASHAEAGFPVARDEQPGLPEALPVAPKTVSELAPASFLKQMIAALTDAMGPMASFVLMEDIVALGESFEAFPKVKLRELVEQSSREISNHTLRARFQQAMLQEIRRAEETALRI